ncbi:MAG: Gfo/Idh/MocA family protein [Mycobacteriales bacterium]
MSASDRPDLCIGVLGMGSRGTVARHAERPGRGSRVTVVCDPDPKAAGRARETFGDVTVVTGMDDLIAAKPDAVVIATPDDAHEQNAVDLLEAGIPVYVEKPLAITVEGADRVLHGARHSKARLYVGHNMRHMPVILLMRDLIARGAIGEVKAVWCRHFVGHGGDFYFKDWHAERSRGTGLLLQKGAHDIDVIHWLASGYTRRVTAMGALTLYDKVADRADNSGTMMKEWFSYDVWPPLSQTKLNPRLDVEDLSMVTMALDNGVFATYQQCHYTPDYWRNYTVIGTEGRLENVGDGEPGSVVKVWNRRHDWDPDGDAVYRVPVETGGHGGADSRIIGEFLDFVRDGGRTNTSPIAAREAVATGVRATESLRDGGMPRDVPPVDAATVAYFEGGQA